MTPLEPGFSFPSRFEWARRAKRWLGLGYAELAQPLGIGEQSLGNYMHPERLPLWFCHYLSALSTGWRPRGDWENVPVANARQFLIAHIPQEVGVHEVLGISLDVLAGWSAPRWRPRVMVMAEAMACLAAPSSLPFNTWEP